MVMEMIDKLELGIICNKNGYIINHRPLLKVLINPFLRVFGYMFATTYDIKTNTLGRPILMECNKVRNIKFTYDNDDEYTRIKRRRVI